ncbi:MAG: ATP-binding protein [Acidobacteriota bacterium]
MKKRQSIPRGDSRHEVAASASVSIDFPHPTGQSHAILGLEPVLSSKSADATVKECWREAKPVYMLDQLEREKEWMESILQSMADPILLTDLNNKVLLQNRRATELLNFSPEDPAPLRQLRELNHTRFTDYLAARSADDKAKIKQDLSLIDPVTGTELHFEVISTPSKDNYDRSVGVVTVFRDVTALRRAGKELEMNFQRLQQAEAQARRERDQLELILENVGVPIVVCDAELNFILTNQRAQALFQADNGAAKVVCEAVNSNKVKLASFISNLSLDFETRNKTELELIDPQTGAWIAYDVISGKICDEQGKVSAIVSILHDLAKLRELERRRVEQQLFESEKMAAIGRMSAQIAHEVNNPLEVIKNSLYLLETTSTVTRQEPQTLRFLEIARKETERVSGIIKQMLGFPRPSGRTELALVNINQLLDETMVLVGKTLQQGHIKTEMNLAANIPVVVASADQLKQVFLNLILNSQQAMENGGTLTITTSLQDEMSEESLLAPSVVVEFTDTGIGIEERDLHNIFEPFYSLNKGKKGTGLGLWVSLGIVRNHGGRIKVNSKVGEGTSFYVILPIKHS